MKLHRFVKDMRDKHVAHNVNAFEEFKVGLILPPAGSDEDGICGVATLGMQLLSHKGTVEPLEGVARALLVTLESEIESVRGGVSAEVASLAMDELRAMSPLALTASGVDSAKRPRKR